MTFETDTTKTNKHLLLLSFFIPFTIMAIIYALMGVYPFGNQTLLTIDLGQQYVDFYRYYRHTLLNEPEALFYSFAKGIGGEMIGLWSYYLNSPFNLLLLLLPDRYLPVGVTLLMLLKIASSGLSFAYLLIKKFSGNNWLVPTFAVAYALMAYTIVNQLNVMWLDGLVFLPLIILGVEKIVDGEKGFFYSFMLALMLFSNYYIGYMICLFVVCYFLFALAKQQDTVMMQWTKKLKFFASRILRFVLFSLLGGGLAAFSLVPNFYSLLGGKVSYMSDTIDWTLKYPFQEILSKFYIGAFDFDQMPTGHPNLFVGTIALVGFLFYFFNRAIPLKERVVALLLTIFFFFSMNVNILNKAWHGMQYPIWYPYRFSFVVSFFFILNGFRSLQKIKTIPLWFACSLLILQTISALYVLQEEFSFVIPLQVLVTAVFLIVVLVLFLLREKDYEWMPALLLVITIIEMSTNAAIDLTRLSYVKMRPFNDYQLVLDDFIEPIRPSDDEFYRIEKVFQRSKNDSFQSNYPSASHFSSTFEKEIPELYGKLGFPDGNGFVSYSSGTLLTDALFGIRYMGENKPLSENLTQKDNFYQTRANSTRPDLRYYEPFVEAYRTKTYLNPHAFSIAFAVPTEVATLQMRDNHPIENQESLLQALTNQNFAEPFYQEDRFHSTVMNNIASSLKGSVNRTYLKEDNEEDASVEVQFTTETTDPYYLVLDSRIDDDVAELKRNGELLHYYKTYRNDQIINIASGEANEIVRFGFHFLEDSLTVRDLELYRFNTEQFEEVVAERKAGGMLDLTSFSQTNLIGDITVAEDAPVLMTTIPYSEGWSLEIDGVRAETYSILDAFLAADIEPGTHQVELTYRPPYLKEGILLSLGSLVIVLLSIKYKPRTRKH